MGVAGCVFVTGMLFLIFSLQLVEFIKFAVSHSRLMLDVALMGTLMAVAQIVAFKIIATFRQHILPLASKVRSYITICFNVFWFGHHLAVMQWVGICIICIGVLVEIINNYNLADRILPN